MCKGKREWEGHVRWQQEKRKDRSVKVRVITLDAGTMMGNDDGVDEKKNGVILKEEYVKSVLEVKRVSS